MSIDFRRSARVSWICAGPPWRRLRRRPWRAPRAREGGSSADPGNPRGPSKVNAYGIFYSSNIGKYFGEGLFLNWPSLAGSSGGTVGSPRREPEAGAILVTTTAHSLPSTSLKKNGGPCVLGHAGVRRPSCAFRCPDGRTSAALPLFERDASSSESPGSASSSPPDPRSSLARLRPPRRSSSSQGSSSFPGLSCSSPSPAGLAPEDQEPPKRRFDLHSGGFFPPSWRFLFLQNGGSTSKNRGLPKPPLGQVD